MPTPPRKDQLEALFIAAEYFEERGEFELAFRCLLDGARGGNDGCWVNLGNFYSNGTGVRRSFARAAYWYRKAYAQGSSSGAHNLAIDYRNAGNLRAAITWFRKALALEDGSSAVELAKLLFARGDRAEAVQLLHRVHDGDLCEAWHACEADREEAAALLNEYEQPDAGSVKRRDRARTTARTAKKRRRRSRRRAR